MKQIFFQEKVKDNLERLITLSNVRIYSEEFGVLTASVENDGSLTKITRHKERKEGYAVGYLKKWKHGNELRPVVIIKNHPEFPLRGEGNIYLTSYDWKEVLKRGSKSIVEKERGSYRAQFLKYRKDPDFDPIIEAFIAYDTLPIEIVLPLVIIK